MARTSASCCVAELTSRGEEEEEGRVAGEGAEEEESLGFSCSAIVLPNSFIAGSFTSDIPMLL